MTNKIQIINEIDDEFIFEDEKPKIREAKMRNDKALKEPQFMYLGRMVNKLHFRAFVYSNEGEKVAEGYDDFMDLINSGIWFSTKEELAVSNAKPKRKNSKKDKVEPQKEELEEIPNEVNNDGPDS